MIWATLAFLGIPIWLVLGGLAGTLFSRHYFKNQDGVVPLQFREAGDDWPRRKSYGRYVHNVLIVNHGLAQVRTSIHVVEHVEPLDPGDDGATKFDDPVAFAVRLDDGSDFEIAYARPDSPIPVSGDPA